MSSQTNMMNLTGTDQEFVHNRPASESPGEPVDVVKSITATSTPPRPPSKSEENEEETCITCREPSTSLREAVPCSHKFHEECILEVRKCLLLLNTMEREDLTFTILSNLVGGLHG